LELKIKEEEANEKNNWLFAKPVLQRLIACHFTEKYQNSIILQSLKDSQMSCEVSGSVLGKKFFNMSQWELVHQTPKRKERQAGKVAQAVRAPA
jgi:hypothetical protein